MSTNAVPTNADEKLERRVGRAWREIRRGAAAMRIRDLFYGDDDGQEALDMAIADALSVLCQRGPMRMGELAAELRITPASTTRAVGCLTNRNYATRVRDSADQRSILVSPTPQGQARYAIVNRRISAGLTEILDEFDESERQQLADLLDRFVASVDRFVAKNDSLPSTEQ